MQSASSNFVRAATGAGGTWAEPNLRVDWSQTGYGGDDSIDNLTRQLGNWTVTHHLDDGYPNAATFISGIGVGQFDAEIGPPPTYLTANTPMTVAEYFSPFNTDSPIQVFDRDVAPTTFDVGVIGDGGAERVRVFTGQMTDIPISGGRANLNAVSATRLKLKTLLQPPALEARREGVNATWPITWALWNCGLHVAPDPVDGCRWWTPMAGSMRSFIPSGIVQVRPFWVYVDEDGDRFFYRPEFVSGPYTLGIYGQAGDGITARVSWPRIVLGDGEDILSQAGNRGRLEFYIRGDTANINDTPASSGAISKLAGFRFDQTNGAYIEAGIHRVTRHPYVIVFDGTNTRTQTHGTALPSDGAWHRVGLAWDVGGADLWSYLDGDEDTSSPVLSTTGLPVVDDVDSGPNGAPAWVSYLPVADIRLITGADALPSAGWVGDQAFTATATVTPSSIELNALIETEPREAWELIGSYAQAELASMRTNENDIFQYLGVGHWAEDAQQTLVDQISTNENAGSLNVNIDPTKIYNAIVVSYNDVQVSAYSTLIGSVTTIITIPPGITTLIVPMQDPIVSASSSMILFSNVDEASMPDDYTLSGLPSLSAYSNSSASGGYYATAAQVGAIVIDWDAGSVIVEINNVTANTWYMINEHSQPGLTLIGIPTLSASGSVTERSTSSIATRGERALSVPAQALQTRYDARRLAQRVRSALRLPVPVVDEFQVFGDPRRQPGDLVTIADPTVTRASGQWRIQSITHESRKTEYIQKVRIRPAFSVGIVGTSLVGQCIVGPLEE